MWSRTSLRGALRRRCSRASARSCRCGARVSRRAENAVSCVSECPQEEGYKPLEQLTLEPYERDHAVVVAEYRGAKGAK